METQSLIEIEMEQSKLPHQRIMTLEQFADQMDGSPISLMTGSFDMLHINHLQALLSMVQDSNNNLVIAVDTDEWVRARKGNQRPFYPFEVRALTIATIMEIGQIQGVVISHAGENSKLIQTIKPKVLMYSEEPNQREEDIFLVQAYGGIAKRLKRGEVQINGEEISTSNLTNLILKKLIES